MYRRELEGFVAFALRGMAAIHTRPYGGMNQKGINAIDKGSRSRNSRTRVSLNTFRDRGRRADYVILILYPLSSSQQCGTGKTDDFKDEKTLITLIIVHAPQWRRTRIFKSLEGRTNFLFARHQIPVAYTRGKIRSPAIF